MMKEIEEYCKEQEGAVATMILYGSQVPVFPILDKKKVNADAILVCTPEYVKHIMMELDVHSSRRLGLSVAVPPRRGA